MPLTSVTPLCITWNGEKLVAAGYDSTILTAVPKDIVKVKVNDRPIVFDVAPIIGEGRTLVPLRHIFEALGAEVKWDASTRTVTGIKGSDKIILKIDSKEALVNGETKELDVPATIVNGRTLVPVRSISESLGAEVSWDDNSKTVIIKTNF
ncbi:copper amine oxidase N-terminal domain-containing protein [Acetivibrio thermocellus]|uniref:copper amine oxidase N-terminal domain-containing protein n=1 Tax=Acetivibrio thermocellus TaxID=1515 RepID=UPI000038FAD4|nr:copper amine oxidase N-terminal domain-containing protein [Acetivibrio thermocellus]